MMKLPVMPNEKTDVKIVRATAEDAAALTAIAFSAKRHWRYPEHWIEAWRDTLTIRADFVNAHEVQAAVLDGREIGFYALCVAGDRLRLEHLWVLPDSMGQGIGRSLFTHAVERARALGFRVMEIESDPNAEGFYQKLGARRVGVNVSELDGQRRELPVLLHEILADVGRPGVD